MSDPDSSAAQTARKQWRLRNSDGKFCLDEMGERVLCQSPPAWTYTDVDLPNVGFSDAARTTHYPAGDIVSEYDAHAVLHTHVYDPSLSDPDA